MRTLIVTVALALAGCAAFPPGPAVRAKGYDGPTLPESEVATVFILDGRPRYESGYICKINGKSATPQNGCASIVYLKPGAHLLSVKYRSQVEVGEGEIPVRVEAGRLYQLNATSFHTRNTGMISLIPMQPGAKLTYRHVAPSLFAGAQLDEPVLYGGP
jgi:hypothetical protein